MQTIDCLICQEDHAAPFYEFGRLKVVKCRQCDLVYVNPRLGREEIQEIYQGAYFASSTPRFVGYADYFQQQRNYMKTFEKRIQIIERFKQPGRICDIGCASGFFLQVAAKRGWDVSGIDLSPQAVEFANKQGFSEVICCDFTNEFVPEHVDKRFDVITLWDYLEHSVEPGKDLLKIYDMLHDDGLLVIETQNIESVTAKIMGRRWWHLVKVREHLYHFSPKTISHLLGQNGFKIIYQTQKHCGKYLDMHFLIERSQLLGQGVHKLFMRLFRPIRDLSIYVNPLDEMLIVAEKVMKHQ